MAEICNFDDTAQLFSKKKTKQKKTRTQKNSRFSHQFISKHFTKTILHKNIPQDLMVIIVV
jgi:hypothetical protein